MKRTTLGLLLSFSAATAQSQQAPSLEELWERLQEQEAEINALKSQLESAETKVEEVDLKVNATAEAMEDGVSGSTSSASWAEKTTIGGYAEHHYNNYSDDKTDQVDAHRFVLYASHQFSDTVRFFSELEVEHGLSGESKPGEVELEQAFIEWDFAQNHSLIAGQFLIPTGFLNEIHEPDTFYGTERNQVEKNIIPTTWWETGVMLKGSLAPGLKYQAGVHSGLEIDTLSGDVKVRSGRQKSAKAAAEDFAYTANLAYTGVQGLSVSATLQYQEDVTQAIGDEDNSAVFTSLNASYSVGDAQIRALWASWDIDGEAFSSVGADEQSGWYIEPSYKFSEKLGVFLRYSEWNNQANAEGAEDSEVFDYGLNYWLHPRVVFKADYSNNLNVDGPDNDSFNLGVGWSF